MDAADPVTVRGRSFFVALARKRDEHQIYIEGVGFPYSATGPVPRYATSRATNRTRVRSGPGSTGCSAAVERGRSRSRPAGTENEIDDPNPTVNTTIRGGSTTATRRLSAAAKGPGEAVTSSYAV